MSKLTEAFKDQLKDEKLFDDDEQTIFRPATTISKPKEKKTVGKPELIELIKARANAQNAAKEQAESKKSTNEVDNSSVEPVYDYVDPALINKNDVVINNRLIRQSSIAYMLFTPNEQNDNASKPESKPNPSSNEVIKVEPAANKDKISNSATNKKTEPVIKSRRKLIVSKPKTRPTRTGDKALEKKKEEAEVTPTQTVEQTAESKEESASEDNYKEVQEAREVKKAVETIETAEIIETIETIETPKAEPAPEVIKETTRSNTDFKTEKNEVAEPKLEKSPTVVEVSDQQLTEILDLFSKKEYD